MVGHLCRVRLTLPQGLLLMPVAGLLHRSMTSAVHVPACISCPATSRLASPHSQLRPLLSCPAMQRRCVCGRRGLGGAAGQPAGSSNIPAGHKRVPLDSDPRRRGRLCVHFSSACACCGRGWSSSSMLLGCHPQQHAACFVPASLLQSEATELHPPQHPSAAILGNIVKLDERIREVASQRGTVAALDPAIWAAIWRGLFDPGEFAHVHTFCDAQQRRCQPAACSQTPRASHPAEAPRPAGQLPDVLSELAPHAEQSLMRHSSLQLWCLQAPLFG